MNFDDPALDEPHACSDPLRRGCITTVVGGTICDECDELFSRYCAEQYGDIPKTRAQRMVEAGVPEGYLSYRWGGCNAPSDFPLDKLRNCRGHPPLLYLHGGVGCGKTAAAVCLISDWLRERRRARYVYAPDWFRALQYDDERLTVFDTVAAYSGLVVLDDVKVEKATPHLAEELTRLVDRRMREVTPLVMISNHALMRGSKRPLPQRPDNLEDAFGGRVVSRLSEGLVLQWRGPDRRRR